MIYEAPLVDGQGQHTGWMSAVLDVSAQRRVEDLSRQQQERLQATARLATIGEMASLLSHELNQPLAAIASYASGSLNLMDQPDAETPTLLRQALQRVAEQAERAGRVIKSVHDFVRRREQLREAIGVDLLVEAVLPLVRLQARKSGAAVQTDVPQPAPRVVCDRTMVEQVLLNLARNAIQAMEHDSDPAARVLRIRVRQTHERWVTFYVADAGPGIDRDLGARLFTPFFTTRSEGMGLGLSLCRTVVEQHGGAMDFDSPVPGTRTGTEFRFTLPAAPAPKLADSRARRAPDTDYMSLTLDPRLGLPVVYLVDDEDVVRDALAWLLRSRRLLSEGFASAEAFWQHLQAQRGGSAAWPTSPACLVLDVRMPGTSGLELFERLVDAALLPALPVIFLTGHGDVPTAVAAVKRGAFDFVEKPFSNNALVDRVEQALALSAADIARRREQSRRVRRTAELTERELEVMRLVIEGHPNKRIADALGISVRTVEVHRARVFEKMDVKSAVELANLLARSAALRTAAPGPQSASWRWANSS